MAPNGSKLLWMVPNGSKLLQIAPHIYKWLQMAPNGSNWLQLPPNASKWLQMAPNGGSTIKFFDTLQLNCGSRLWQPLVALHTFYIYILQCKILDLKLWGNHLKYCNLYILDFPFFQIFNQKSYIILVFHDIYLFLCFIIVQLCL